jgi:hypothetical protein
VSEIFSYHVLRWLHVLVMGYWIGSDLVVNALTFYVVRSSGLPPAERKRLWDFLIHVDQHPRNALILSVPLGFTLAAQLGLVSLDDAALIVLWAASAVWFGYMWVAHWKRQAPIGDSLAKWDWRTRYLLIAAFLVMGIQSLLTGSPLATHWLAWKVILFAAVMACGIGIRHYMRQTYRSWPRIWEGRGTAEDEAWVLRSMVRATRVLWLLWALLFVIGWLGVARPRLG